MKTAFITLTVFVINIHFLFAQLPAANTCSLPETACLNSPYNGTIDLANPDAPHSIPNNPLTRSYAKVPLNPNFGDVKYVNDELYDPVKCPAPDIDQCDNDGSSLIYDVYYPTDHDYSNCPLPAIILFHAGGFIECTNLRQPDIKTVCQELAKRGYVAFSVEYRTGRIRDKFKPKQTTVQQQLAIYRACQDARGAIRSIILRQLREGTGSINDPYRINPNKIFVGGFSAGGLMAMNATWYTPSMVYSIFPNGGAGSATIQQALGFIDADFYYASKSALVNEQGYDYQTNIIGNACMWSGIGIPVSFDSHEYDFFDPTLLKPLISFQGRLDPTFPYPDGDPGQIVNFYSSATSIYNSTNFCINATTGNYFLNRNASSPDLINGSTLNMRNVLLHYGIADEHYVDCDMVHGFTTDASGFHGNFGTTAANSTAASIYLAKRIATFFQAVLNGNENNLGTNYFPDCQNTRVKCNAKTTTCVLPDCE